jgi:putative copper export protein
VLAEVTGHLADWLTALRLSLHVGAATVWVGGQITLGGLVPTVRRLSPEAPSIVAKAFARIEWPAFVVLLATGVWNVMALHNGKGIPNFAAVMGAKYVVVLLAVVAVGLHTHTKSPKMRGISAGLGLLASLVAMVLGVVLAG